MNRREVAGVMSVLRGAYPQFYRDMGKKEAEDVVNLWFDMFRPDDPCIVAAAVKSFIEGDEKGFPPTIGQVKAKIRLICGSDELTEAEAWGIISKALRNGIYGAEEEFAKLSPTMQRIVGSSAQLREWATMDTDTLQSVVASNFQRSYRAISSKEREIGKLPEDVKRLVQSVQEQRSLGAGAVAALPSSKYESLGDTMARMQAERQEGYTAAVENDTRAQKRREEIIAILKGE